MPFKSGQGGRQLGAGNKSTKALRDVLAKLGTSGKVNLHAKRLHELTQSTDEHVAIKALGVVMAYRYGKPTEHLEIGGPDGGPVRVRFVDA